MVGHTAASALLVVALAGVGGGGALVAADADERIVDNRLIGLTMPDCSLLGHGGEMSTHASAFVPDTGPTSTDWQAVQELLATAHAEAALDDMVVGQRGWYARVYRLRDHLEVVAMRSGRGWIVGSWVACAGSLDEYQTDTTEQSAKEVVAAAGAQREGGAPSDELECDPLLGNEPNVVGTTIDWPPNTPGSPTPLDAATAASRMVNIPFSPDQLVLSQQSDTEARFHLTTKRGVFWVRATDDGWILDHHLECLRRGP